MLLRRNATALLRTNRALSTTTQQPWFRAAGEGTLLLRFGNSIDERHHGRGARLRLIGRVLRLHGDIQR